MPMNVIFTAMIRTRRRQLGLTQREVAEACGVTPEAVTMFESGQRHPSLDLVPTLADALQMDRAELCWLSLEARSLHFAAALMSGPPEGSPTAT